ncbi:MAG: metallophosphoesterase [Lachnospiraceae bacterium]|nr:metallophosphoesterase [Clostridiales bacterium]MCD7863810.1 metallophosphoesterase [Lachnospiraceae bacterium]
MIFVTGDIHGSLDIAKLSAKQFPAGKQLTRSDYVIICGDFSLPFLPSDLYPEDVLITDKDYRASRNQYWKWMRWLNEKTFTILWLDGNHDNHPFWQAQPVTEWNGGLVNVHPLAENVIHLRRGEYYTIDGTTFWVMGGAASHDREGRVEGFNWWPEEVPSVQEQMHGLDTLAAHGNRVDYILTRTLPQSLMAAVCGKAYAPEPTQRYLDQIYANTEFKYWFCGHMHVDSDKPCYRIRELNDDIVQLEEAGHDPA